MNPYWINAGTFGAVALLAVGLMSCIHEFRFGYRTAVRTRLNKLTGKRVETERDALFKKFALRESDIAAHGGHWKQRLEELRIQSGIRWGMAKLVGAAIVCGAACAILAVWFTTMWLSLIPAFAVGFVAPLGFVRWKRNQRIDAMTKQLPRAFDVIGRAVKAGQTAPVAFQVVAQEFPPPISEEFRACVEQQNLGVSYETALRQLGSRTGIMELQILVVALIVQARTGGSLAKILENLSVIVRKRLRLKQRIKALTGEGRMQALVLTILPFAAFFGLMLLAPDYIAVLLSRPWVLACTLAAQVLGVIWIRRCVNFEF